MSREWKGYSRAYICRRGNHTAGSFEETEAADVPYTISSPKRIAVSIIMEDLRASAPRIETFRIYITIFEDAR
ncbi:uncharacterized protein PHALS_11227 [Plasmopara halstedii]|uniref:Uncharacterized protein n=1 Tax=Plasmopara halstedii TaxID=4781 RepID=A0A0P1AJP9_PLAHL|nr:uncharacterized protein PHALS_11227 [Plasmopara halstedii]CEG41058.1 hypothetical protein PHALS_11227 [Plasmopara halstedii]|eukprot:XP_024577427.1 hypothetical protein PHALS_11227 [Plasmopara halstedii]